MWNEISYLGIVIFTIQGSRRSSRTAKDLLDVIMASPFTSKDGKLTFRYIDTPLEISTVVRNPHAYIYMYYMKFQEAVEVL